MNSKIKIGIVGARFAAEFHYKCYKRIYGVPVEVVGVFSQNPQSSRKFAERNSISSTSSLEELINSVDVIDICAPAYVHEDIGVRAFKAGKHVIIEKPLTGYFGSIGQNFDPAKVPKEEMMKEAMASAYRIREAGVNAKRKLMYAENWVYAPSVQKEREILCSSQGQILWMLGEESHSGSHSSAYGDWSKAGGGSIVGKGCHPLTAALYLKREEGRVRLGQPLRPLSVSARVHNITQLSSYQNKGFLRSDYLNVEDYGQIHLTFDDGMVADIFSTEIVLGGVHNWLEIMANNHRSRCNINPTDSLTTFNPKEDQLKDVYIVEKIGTKQGWNYPSPDEDWMTGYPQELQDFMECIAEDREPQCGGELAQDVVAVMYASYVSAERQGVEIKVPRQ